MTFSILGILNVTPDSFSDGGQFLSLENTIQQAHKLRDDGADWIDIGAESTRPGSSPISTDLEWSRLKPCLEQLKDLPLSIDTANTAIMQRCLDYGVKVINCTEGVIENESILNDIQKNGCHYIAMHRHGCSKFMQKNTLTGKNVIPVLEQFYQKAWQRLQSAGFAEKKIWLDPGYGFGKDLSAHTHLMAHTHHFSKNYQTVVGISRKSWIGSMLNIPLAKDRDHASRMLEAGLIFSGAKMVRSHDVKVLSEIRKMLNA